MSKLERCAAMDNPLTLLTTFILCFCSIAVCKEAETLSENSGYEFSCPLVDDLDQYKRIVVTITLNNAIWMKVDHGNVTIARKLTHFIGDQSGSKRQETEAGRKRALLNAFVLYSNDARYKFTYNGSRGLFKLDIDHLKADDVGYWQCHVTLFFLNGPVDELSSDRLVTLHGVKPDLGFGDAHMQPVPRHRQISSQDYQDLKSAGDFMPSRTVVVTDNDAYSSSSGGRNADDPAAPNRASTLFMTGATTATLIVIILTSTVLLTQFVNV